jgi:hypothetical protein
MNEATFVDGLLDRLDGFENVETEVRIEPSGARCDILVESQTGNRYAIEAADALTWGDPTQAVFYADALDARPVVAIPPDGALDELLPLATTSEATILPIKP